ncbi:Triacylglycerol lipase [Klebsormidium nitens]|uniref:Triacylglycerol lipase n=1 Tax=Klebsormidium nitens TaxID=105231 RepID=A0A1Y1HSZ2_KLENI|nr:Triacylglycerol lipase [Klebsormidium nitens]|eukprot:GAQ78948.1 Triacylglycerol lipase [Klebsormidium nitens]
MSSMEAIKFPIKVVSLLWKTVLENGWFESLVLLILITISAVAELFSRILSPLIRIFPYDSFSSLVNILDPAFQLDKAVRESFPNVQDAGSKSNLVLAALSSALAYENLDKIRKVITADWQMAWFAGYNFLPSGSRALLFHASNPSTGEQAVVLTFKGTEPFFLRDWLVDGRTEMYRHRPTKEHPEWETLGAMHRGFLFALGLVDRPKSDPSTSPRFQPSVVILDQFGQTRSVSGALPYDRLKLDLTQILTDNPAAQLLITGHSLGGALAVLFTAHILADVTIPSNPVAPPLGTVKPLKVVKPGDNHFWFSRLGGLYTFGQPRVGDVRFAVFMEQLNADVDRLLYFRFVHNDDVVPRLPPATPRMYQHVQPLLYITEFGSITGAMEQPPLILFKLIIDGVFKPFVSGWLGLILAAIVYPGALLAGLATGLLFGVIGWMIAPVAFVLGAVLGGGGAFLALSILTVIVSDHFMHDYKREIRGLKVDTVGIDTHQVKSPLGAALDKVCTPMFASNPSTPNAAVPKKFV